MINSGLGRTRGTSLGAVLRGRGSVSIITFSSLRVFSGTGCGSAACWDNSVCSVMASGAACFVDFLGRPGRLFGGAAVVISGSWVVSCVAFFLGMIQSFFSMRMFSRFSTCRFVCSISLLLSII